MRTIIALILAIPTYGTSLLVLIIYNYYWNKFFIDKVNKTIKWLSTDDSPLSTSFYNIKYIDACNYVDKFGSITCKENDYIEFDIDIEKIKYSVILNRDINGRDATLHSMVHIGWVDKIQEWIANHHSLSRYFPKDNEDIINIEHLNISSCNIDYIPPEIGNFKKLKTLILDNNNLSYLPNEIGNLKNLETLTFGWNKIHSLPQEIVNLKKLKKLSLCGDVKLFELIMERVKFKDLSMESFDENVKLCNDHYAKIRDYKTNCNNIIVFAAGQKDWINELKSKGCDLSPNTLEDKDDPNYWV